MIISQIVKFCEKNNISYVYSIQVEDKVYFCALNSSTSLYTFYQLVGDSIEVYESDLSLVNAKFKRTLLLEMGGTLLEQEG